MILTKPDRDVGRFLLVGAGCALLSNTVYIGGDVLGFRYPALIAASYLLTLPVSYLAHALWTFSMPLGRRGFGRYVLSTLTSFALASATVALLCGPCRLPMILAAPLATLIMLVWNYLSSRWAITGRLGRAASN